MVYTVYIGTYAGQKPDGQDKSNGLFRASLSDDGKLTLIDAYESASPTYLTFSPDRKFLYAANETRETDGIPGGAVTAFAVAEDGSLKKLATRPTGGGSPCHVLARGSWLYAANYGAGTVTAYKLTDGVPGEAVFTHVHQGGGPVKKRQEGPHAHCAMSVPGTDTFCVVDLGIDQARFYRQGDGAFELVQALPVKPGAGPRHVVFSADGRFGWIVTELSNEVYAIRRGGGNGGVKWELTGAYSTLPASYTGQSSCAAIHRSADGGMIVASNRGHDSVARYTADRATGLLTPAGIYPTGGEQPRDIRLSPDDRWLLAANMKSNSVTVLSVNDGFRIMDGAGLGIPQPACILF